jgi:hypothetical protein
LACAGAAAAAGGAHAPEVCAGLCALAQSPLDAEVMLRRTAAAAQPDARLTTHPAHKQAQHLARFLLQLYSLKAAAVASPQAAVRRRPRSRCRELR